MLLRGQGLVSRHYGDGQGWASLYGLDMTGRVALGLDMV